ncbi:CDP-alcohol phosphatidyltransferase family protein [Mesonia aquimarina]|uniref:CDP-alcohol phosphatidyltransferase family protein n=1 Tax=Mesonia aquimarina TaxID=1504967 RepID=UPI000EF5D565|nr:CDP-alcohol phosphatidyltransferase family protein [Mesonia aquimarina]
MRYKPTIPDYLSLLRILIAILLALIVLFKGEKIIFGILMITGFLSDFLDGYIARHYNQVTTRGASLDSAGDAILSLIVILGIVHFETSFIKEHLYSIIPVVFLYFFQLAFAYLKYGNSSSFHTYAAKLAAGIQGVFFTVIIFFKPLQWLLYITLIISVLETLEEIILIKKLNKPQTDIKGLYWILKEKK